MNSTLLNPSTYLFFLQMILLIPPKDDQESIITFQVYLLAEGIFKTSGKEQEFPYTEYDPLTFLEITYLTVHI